MAVAAPQRVSLLVRIASRLVATLLRVGVPIGPLVLLTVPGRASGRPRTTPVALLQRDGHRWLIATFGEVNWTRNLRVSAHAILSKGRQQQAVVAVELTPEAAGRVLHDAVALDTTSRMLALVLRRLVGATPDASLDSLIDQARRHPVFELKESRVKPQWQPRSSKRIDVGMILAPRELTDISGERVRIPDADRLVHLQFRRFAGCPYCNLHLRSMARRHAEIAAAGAREVVLFHSSVAELLFYQADLPFAVVADPEKRLYTEFGVESSKHALLAPGAWLPGLRGVWRVLRQPQPRIPDFHGGVLGLPADFLIASDGRVLARKYGAHAYDQWSVDELLDLVRSPSVLSQKCAERSERCWRGYRPRS